MTAARLAAASGASEASVAPTRIVEMMPDVDEEDEENTTNDHIVSQYSKSSNNTQFVPAKKSCCVKFVLWELSNTDENLKDMKKSCCLELV